MHQARKSIRRARAALALGRGTLGPAGRRLDESLASLCRGLSPLRDAQALLEGLERLAVGATPELRAVLPELVTHARMFRDAQLDRTLARDPGMARRRERLNTKQRRLAALAWPDVTPDAVGAALLRSEARVRKARDRTQRKPANDENWHALRRRLRRLRLQDQLLSEVEPRLRPSVKIDSKEAALLGESQDDALLLRHCGTRSPFPPAMRKLLRAEVRARLGRVRGRHARG